MKPANKIKKMINKSDVTTGLETEKRILGDALEHLAKLKKQSVPIQPNIWGTIMKSKITKLAAAAVIIILVLIGINQFDGLATSVAWADVAEKLDKIHSYIYRQRESKTSGPQKEGFEFIGQDTEQIIYNSANYGRRTDCYKGGQLIFSIYTLPQEKALINILHYSKEYIRHPLSNGQVGRTDLPIREMVKSLLSNDYVELGRDTIDGVHVEGVELSGQKISGPRLDDAVTRLWVDVETGLPVRIELEGLTHGTSTNVMIVQDEFQWNVELLAGDFEPIIPPDYSVVERELPSEPKPEESLTAKEKNQELNLPDLGDLNLLGLDVDEPDITVPLVGMIEIWRAQDEIVSTWLDYSDVREQLYEELLEKLDPSNLSDEQLLATVVALREKFWETGGCLSKKSYPYGYAARLLLESAHIGNPEDMTVTDELVETIMSVELAWKYEENSDEKIRNIALRETLMELRMAQFEQIKRELEEGRSPIWEDFVRVNDLAILLGIAGDFESAQDVVEWLIQEAERGGWAAYMEPIENMQRHFNEGEGFNYNISVARKVDFPEGFRYGRRLPSFKGPKKRGTVPIHLLEKNPVWH
jgi:outer membrane lipoprotein-sorting protein